MDHFVCSYRLGIDYRGQHDRDTQVANTQHFGWVFATWVFTTLGIVEVGYSVFRVDESFVACSKPVRPLMKVI